MQAGISDNDIVEVFLKDDLSTTGPVSHASTDAGIGSEGGGKISLVVKDAEGNTMTFNVSRNITVGKMMQAYAQSKVWWCIRLVVTSTSWLSY